MGYIDDYKARLNAYGGSISGTLEKSTKKLINSSFKDFPFYKEILVNNVLTPVRVVEGKDSKNKTLLFMPDSLHSIGESVSLDSSNWLITDTNASSNDVYPKASIQYCNENLKWKISDGTIYSYPCIATVHSTFTVDENSSNVNQIDGGLYVFVQYNLDLLKITQKTRFILGSQVYEMDGLDDVSFMSNGKGLVRFSMKLTNKSDKDDFTNKLAFNENVGGTTPPPDTGGGWL